MASTVAWEGLRVLSLTLTLPDSSRRSTVANFTEGNRCR